MPINKISGNILQDNLQRGSNLSVQGNLVFFDITNTRLGINTNAPTATLNVVGNTDIAGNISVGNLNFGNGVITGTGNITGNGVTLSANAISASSGLLTLGSNANIKITGGGTNYLFTTDGTGNLFWSDPGNLAGVIGNTIDLGTPSLGNLTSNAVTMTTTTTVTDGIAQLNTVLGKLVPASPSNFPGSQTLSISSLSTYRMTNITQVDNTPGANKSVAAGATVTSVRRAATYATNTISTVGPGDTGIIR